MSEINVHVLREVIENYQNKISLLTEISLELDSQPELTKVIKLYDQVYPAFEKMLWQSDDFEQLLATYQDLFREQELLISQSGHDHRNNFLLSIPIADRPEHLRSCLESIYQLCLLYSYGTRENGEYKKVRVIVAEDSKHQENVLQDMALAEEYTKKGLQVIHFGQTEQYELQHEIPDEKRHQLKTILTDQEKGKFYLKGQAANRNLSYLKFLQLTDDTRNTLYYLVDSDQLFQLNRQTESGEEFVPALNYFYYINRIFSETETIMLTGKLVGDPPVSPSVMAANFLDDVLAYFRQLSELSGQQECQFHQKPGVVADDAAYHDMAMLFGFEKKQNSFPYRCRINGEHNHLKCLQGFTRRLNDFFFGEHLTRKTYFKYQSEYTELQPARTIYPGNYIVSYSGLKYIIPFGDQRLRMSGPTAGRLIQGEIGERFSSANIPMLHARTLLDESAQDFRPGVERQDEKIDLADEFERQFFGDLMLFTVVELSRFTDFVKPLEEQLINKAISKVEAELLVLYQEKHDAVMKKNKQLEQLVNDPGIWWNRVAEARPALLPAQQFISNITLNFSDQSVAYQQIQSLSHRQQRKNKIINALLNYRQQRNTWDSLFD